LCLYSDNYIPNTLFMKQCIVAIFLISALFATAQNKFRHPAGEYISVNHAKLWIEQQGSGDPIILISGGPGSAHVGMHSFDTLAGFCRLIYVDGYGRGKSDVAKDVKEYTLERDIDDIEGIRKALDIEKISVLGHSYGGLVAQGYALKYPNHVKKLILASTFHSFIMWQENDDNSNHEIKENYPEIWDTLAKLREKGLISSDTVHQEIYSQVPYGFLYGYNPENFRRGIDAAYPNSFNTALYYQMVGKDGDFVVGSDIGSFDYRKELKKLSMPVLIVAGRYDRVAVPRMQVVYKDYCPQARFVMFERSGHNPQVEEKGKFYDLVKDFMIK
jgi:proline iminopeptidase